MDGILHNYLVHICGADSVERDAALSMHTTFRIGGPAKYFVTVNTKEVLMRLISALKFLNYPYFIIGMGANVLADSAGYDGVVIKLGFKEITHTDNFIYADAGAKLGVVVNYARDNGMSGLEWAAGIPATIGGATYMNCGAFGKEMKDSVVMADILEDGYIRTITAKEIDFGYRRTIFQTKDWVILGVYLRMLSGDKDEIAATIKDILIKRASHPKNPSAGSVFKRPRDGFYVGRVIEELGLKGHQIGGARVSDTHCGFIINMGGATSSDVKNLISKIQSEVKTAHNVDLQSEIIMLGNKNDE